MSTPHAIWSRYRLFIWGGRCAALAMIAVSLVCQLAFAGPGELLVEKAQGADFVVPKGTERITFSPDGNRRVIVVRRDNSGPLGGLEVHVDQKAVGTYDEVGRIAFSPDAKRLAFRARRKDQWVLFVDRAEVELIGGPLDPRMDWDPVFSPQGELAYIDGVPNNRRCRLIREQDQEAAVWQAIDSPRFSPNGKDFAYLAQQDDEWFIVRNGDRVAGSTADFFSQGSLKFSPDGSQLACDGYRKKGRGFVVFDDNVSEPFDQVWHMAFSPNGKHFAFSAARDRKWLFVVDGIEMPARNAVSWIVFSPDSRVMAYKEIPGKRRAIAMCPGVEEKEYPAIDELAFSWDSKRLAYAAIDNTGYRVVSNGQEGPVFDYIGNISFSADSKHIAYIAKQKEKLMMVCDGIQGPVHDDVYALDYMKHKPDRMRYIVVDDGRGRVVEAEWP